MRASNARLVTASGLFYSLLLRFGLKFITLKVLAHLRHSQNTFVNRVNLLSSLGFCWLTWFENFTIVWLFLISADIYASFFLCSLLTPLWSWHMTKLTSLGISCLFLRLLISSTLSCLILVYFSFWWLKAVWFWFNRLHASCWKLTSARIHSFF